MKYQIHTADVTCQNISRLPVSFVVSVLPLGNIISNGAWLSLTESAHGSLFCLCVSKNPATDPVAVSLPTLVRCDFSQEDILKYGAFTVTFEVIVFDSVFVCVFSFNCLGLHPLSFFLFLLQLNHLFGKM